MLLVFFLWGKDKEQEQFDFPEFAPLFDFFQSDLVNF